MFADWYARLEKTPSIVVTGDSVLLTRLDNMLWNCPNSVLGHVLLQVRQVVCVGRSWNGHACG